MEVSAGELASISKNTTDSGGSLNDLPVHGGDINAASKRYGLPAENWIDLSTGINPLAYAFKPIAESAYTRLPYLQPGFMEAATHFYGDDRALAVPGSQPVIQLLPSVLKGQSILVPQIGYQEHAQAWQASETRVVRYPSLEHDEAVDFVTESLQQNPHQHLLVINPNNPSGIAFDILQLQAWAATMSSGYYLLVDEAFIECSHVPSILGPAMPLNTVVLRSFGKFFGLAGLRLGFVFAEQPLLKRIAHGVGLWQVNGPSQSIAIQAYPDKAWQQLAKQTIDQNFATTLSILQPLMQTLGAKCLTESGLFISHLIDTQAGEAFYSYLASHGVLMRLVKVDSHRIIVRSGIVNRSDEAATARFRTLVDSYRLKATSKGSPRLLDTSEPA